MDNSPWQTSVVLRPRLARVVRVGKVVLAGVLLIGAGLLLGCQQSSQRERQLPSLLHDAPRLMHGVGALRDLLPKPIRALSLRVKPNRILLQVQDKAHKSRVEQYRFKRGSILGPIGVELRGDGKLSDNLFPLSYADLEVLPRLIRQAEERAGLESGRALEVVLQRNLPMSMDILFTVTVSGQEGSRTVVARKDGTIFAVRPGLPPESTARASLQRR